MMKWKERYSIFNVDCLAMQLLENDLVVCFSSPLSDSLLGLIMNFVFFFHISLSIMEP